VQRIITKSVTFNIQLTQLPVHITSHQAIYVLELSMTGTPMVMSYKHSIDW